MVWQAIVGFFKAVGSFYVKYKVYIDAALTLATTYTGVKNYRQAQDMLAQGANILANKTSAGGKLPVIYGNRRVGAQIVYMSTSDNNSKDLYVVYALSVGEVDDINLRSVELDGNSLTNGKRFDDGGYIGSDRNGESGYSGHEPLNYVSQNGGGVDAGAGRFGTDPSLRYRYVLNAHHGAATQTADPMLVASMPEWTTAHKLNGVAYIAAHFGFGSGTIWTGIPQLTVQVKGKRVYDPRDTDQTFGTPSTYKYSSNPSLCFLEYISNPEYGKGLLESQINMTTFGTAATICDSFREQPYFNNVAQSVTWSSTSGSNEFNITGSDANEKWWQAKIGEVLSIYDQNGDGVITESEITDVQRNEFYDSSAVYIITTDEAAGSTESDVPGSYLIRTKRFQCNGYVDNNKTVMQNSKELLSNMRGIFTYVNGKYEVQVEDTGTSTFSITDNHIISENGIAIDYGDKDKKANKVIVEFFNANKKYELDTTTVLHDASPEYYSDDGDEVLEIKVEFPFVTDPYVAYNMGKSILVRSRNQMTIQFVGTPEMYKLNIGDIVDITYAGLGLGVKVCRVEALQLQANGLVAVSLIEYFDVYTWEVPAQEPTEKLATLPSAYAVKAPTGLAFVDTDSSATGRPFLTWNVPTDFPNYQYRVNVVDSSSNQLLNKIVDVENCDMTMIPIDNGYVASVTSLNTLGTESSPATLTFNVTNIPVKGDEVTVGGSAGTTVGAATDYGAVGTKGDMLKFVEKVDFVDEVEFSDFVDFVGDVVFNTDNDITIVGQGLAVQGRIDADGGLQLASGTAPTSATATGLAGEIRWDANYIYVCVATNTWKRVAISTW